VHQNLSGCFELLQAAELEGIRGAHTHLTDACERLQEQQEEKEAAFAVRTWFTITAACLLSATASCIDLNLQLTCEL
jgi:hypothetical protein